MKNRLTPSEKSHLYHLLSYLGPKFPWPSSSPSSSSSSSPPSIPIVTFYPEYVTGCDAWYMPISKREILIGISRNFFNHSLLGQEAILGHELAHHYQYLMEPREFLQYIYYDLVGPFSIYEYLTILNWIFLSLLLLFPLSPSIFLALLSLTPFILYTLYLNRQYELGADLYMAQYLGREKVLPFFREEKEGESFLSALYRDLLGTHPSSSTIYSELIKNIPSP